MSSGPPDGLGNAMAESHHHDHGGNYGPVVGILFLIAFLTGGAVAVARYLVGPQAFQRTGYDLEAFVQRKFAVCLGGGGAAKPAAPTPPVTRVCDVEPEATEVVLPVEASEPPVEEVVEEEEEESAAAADP